MMMLTQHLQLKVKSSTDTTTNTYTLAQGITGLDNTSKVYFLQEVENGRFEVYFGDGVLGKAVDGNIIILDYIVCNRDGFNDVNHLHYLEQLVVFQMSQSQQLITIQVVIILKQ